MICEFCRITVFLVHRFVIKQHPIYYLYLCLNCYMTLQNMKQ